MVSNNTPVAALVSLQDVDLEIVITQARTRIFMRFNLPESKELIKVDGTIVWRNEYNPNAPRLYPPGIGVKFINLKPKDRKKLRAFLSRIEALSNRSTSQ